MAGCSRLLFRGARHPRFPRDPRSRGPHEPIYAYALAIDGYAVLPIMEGRKLLDLAEQLQGEGRLDELSTKELRLALFSGNRAPRWDARPHEWDNDGFARAMARAIGAKS